jgi:nicotinamidase-related amidase
MPTRNLDLHGSVPDSSDVALLIIDCINDLEFDNGPKLLKHAMPMARRIAALKKKARALGIPSIYVNDNFGKWQSDFRKILSHCLQDGVRGEPIARILKPASDDYFVLKPKHSGFYSTTLDTLLHYLQADTLILTGMAANICILFTANDAYMRDYHLVVPADCVASNEKRDNDYALAEIEKHLKADVTPSTRLDLGRLKETAAARAGKHTLVKRNGAGRRPRARKSS